MRASFRARLASLLRHFLDVPGRSELAAVRLDVAELAAIECMRARELDLLLNLDNASAADVKRYDTIMRERQEMQIGYGRRRGGSA